MSWLIFASIAGVVLTVLLFFLAESQEWDLLWVFSLLFGFVTAICIVACMVLGFSWKASEYKAKIINREYDTSYSREEVFYAHDVIDTIRELDRKRIEIDGNLMRKTE